MTALNDTERAVRNWTAGRPHRPAPMRPPRSEETASERPSRYYPTWLPSRSFIAAVIAIGGCSCWRPWTAPSPSSRYLRFKTS